MHFIGFMMFLPAGYSEMVQITLMFPKGILVQDTTFWESLPWYSLVMLRKIDLSLYTALLLLP